MPGHRPGTDACSSGVTPRSCGALAPAECHGLLKRVSVHLVVQGPHADAQQVSRSFAVVVALLQGCENRGFLDLGHGCLQGHHLSFSRLGSCAGGQVSATGSCLVGCISLGRSSMWMAGPSTVT